MAKHKDSYQRALAATIALASRVLNACNREKVPRDMNLWIVGLLARAASCARAVAGLVDADHSVEAKILVRALYDAVIDLMFLKDHPQHARTLLHAFRLEACEDRWEHVRFIAHRRDESVEEFLAKHPHLDSIRRQYEAATRDPVFTAKKDSKSPWGQRWRNVSAFVKLGAVGRELSAEHFEYAVRRLGDTQTHHRPSAIELHWYKRADGTVEARSRPRRADPLYSSNNVRFEACLLLLIACDQAADAFYLSQRFEGPIRRMMKRLYSLAPLRMSAGSIRV